MNLILISALSLPLCLLIHQSIKIGRENESNEVWWHHFRQPSLNFSINN